MKTPKFEVGDWVTFELDEDDYPRWWFNIDGGSSGKWVRHVVTCVTRTYLETATPNDMEVYSWPMPGSEIYEEGQWKRPGYLRKL